MNAVRFVFSCLFLCGLGAFAFAPARAQQDSATPFTILKAEVHADTPLPEICLTFSAQADFSSREALASALELEIGKKSVRVKPSELSVWNNELCLQDLSYRASYTIRVNGIESANGKGVQGYKKTFAVPDRAQALGFVRKADSPVLPRYGRGKDEKNSLPRLRTVNVPSARLTLYRFADLNNFAQAWGHFVHNALTPSESLVFARERGEVVFESDLVFNDRPNIVQTVSAPLPSREKLTRGLYYLAALPEGGSASNPALLAGQWFLVSDLRASAFMFTEGLMVFAAEDDVQKPASGAKAVLAGRDGRVLAQADLVSDGSAFLPLADTRQAKDSLVFVQGLNGDLDIFDLARVARQHDPHNNVIAFLRTDRETYAPGDRAIVRMRAEDLHGNAIFVKDSVLRLVRPDGRIYGDYPVSDAEGLAVADVTLPETHSDEPWRFLWLSKNGEIWAENRILFQGEPLAVLQEEQKLSDNAKKTEDADFLAPALIEIKETAREVFFPGSRHITFDVVARNLAERSSFQAPLYFTIVEEGRSFAWKPSEGHWDYSLLPHHRRLGGGKLFLNAQAKGTLSWNVVPGRYVLEIANAQGNLLARHAFDGQDASAPFFDRQEVRIFSPAKPLAVRKTSKIRFHLTRPALIGAVVSDDEIRETFMRPFPAGENVLSLTPTEKWGKKIRLTLQALTQTDQTATIVEEEIEIEDSARTMRLVMPKPPREAVSGTSLVLPVRLEGVAKKGARVQAIAVPLFSGANAKDVIFSSLADVDAKGTARVRLELPELEGTMRVIISAWNEKQYAEESLILPVKPALGIFGAPLELVQEGDWMEAEIVFQNNAAPAGEYHTELRAPEGLSLNSAATGSFRLKKGEQSKLLLSFVARDVLDDVVRLGIKGPNGFKKEIVWPVRVRSSRPLEERMRLLTIPSRESLSRKSTRGGLLVASFLLPELLPALERLAYDEPLTTLEIAAWLEASRLWSETLSAMRLMGQERQRLVRAQRLRRLLRHQREDGGFGLLDRGGGSDMLCTAAALEALKESAGKSFDLAAAWLNQKLGNTWFEEKERAPRAAAFAALARAGRVDLSALRYFARTGENKKTSAETAAALGLAFQLAGDDAAQGRLWRQRAGREPRAWPLPALRLLSLNGDVSAAELQRGTEALARRARDGTSEKQAMWLVAFARALDKAGPWRIETGGETRKIEAGPLFLNEETAEIKNVSSHSLDVLMHEPAEKKAGFGAQEAKTRNKPHVSFRQTLYYTDGNQVPQGVPLKADETYLALLEAEISPESEVGLRVSLSGGAAYALDFPDRAAAGTIARILGPSSENIRMPTQRVRGIHSIGFVLDGKGPWRVPFFVRPLRRGSYGMPAPVWGIERGNAHILPSGAWRAEVR